MKKEVHQLCKAKNKRCQHASWGCSACPDEVTPTIVEYDPKVDGPIFFKLVD